MFLPAKRERENAWIKWGSQLVKGIWVESSGKTYINIHIYEIKEDEANIKKSE